MNCKKWVEKKMKNFQLCDYSALKIAMLLIGMILGAYLAVFVKTYLWYFVVVAVILCVYLLYKFFK